MNSWSTPSSRNKLFVSFRSHCVCKHAPGFGAVIRCGIISWQKRRSFPLTVSAIASRISKGTDYTILWWASCHWTHSTGYNVSYAMTCVCMCVCVFGLINLFEKKMDRGTMEWWLRHLRNYWYKSYVCQLVVCEMCDVQKFVSSSC